MAADKRGLYSKYKISRNDGQDHPGKKHENCELFVLDLTHDRHARRAAWEYATLCRHDRPNLSQQLFDKLATIEANNRE